MARLREERTRRIHTVDHITGLLAVASLGQTAERRRIRQYFGGLLYRKALFGGQLLFVFYLPLFEFDTNLRRVEGVPLREVRTGGAQVG